MTTPTPPPPAAEQTNDTPPSFPPPTTAEVLGALRAPAIGYLWLLLAAVVMVGLILVASAVGSTGDETGVESDDISALGVLIGMPFQIAGMALLGTFHFSEDGVGASLFLPPLLLTAVYLVMTARAARRGGLIPAAGTRGLVGVIVGFVTAAVLTPATWALAMRAEGLALHTASVSLFFGTWLLTGAASYVGTSRAARAGLPAWIPADYAAAARIWGASVAVWVVIAGVVLTVVAAVKEDLWVAILSPLWGVTAALYTYAVGHLGGLSFAGQGADIGDLSAVWTIALVVAALLLAILTSIAWHLRRDTRETTLSQPGSWAVMPATYALGGLLVWLVPTVMVGGGLSGFGGSVSFQPAPWLLFVLAAWGGAVEVISRFVAPTLAAALPSRLRAVLRGPERAEAAPRSDAAVAAPAPARPLTPEERARYKKLGIVAAALAAVGVVGWITVSVVNSQLYGPEQRAAAYLDAVVDADLDEANDLASTDEEQVDASLLTTEIYRAADNRITGYELGDVDSDGGTVTVEVRLEGLGSPMDAELTLEKAGRTAVLFDKWRVAEGGLAKAVSLAVPEGAGDLTVNGVSVEGVDDDVWLLPGDYVIDAFAGNQWLETSGEPITVTEEDYQYAEVSGAVASEAFREEVQRQVDAHLAECMASTELEPAGCPNSAFGFGDARKVKWTMTQAPTVDFDGFDGTFPADLSYGDSGRATVTYETDESYGFGPRDWQPQTEESELYLTAVTVTEDGGSLLVTIGE